MAGNEDRCRTLAVEGRQTAVREDALENRVRRAPDRCWVWAKSAFWGRSKDVNPDRCHFRGDKAVVGAMTEKEYEQYYNK